MTWGLVAVAGATVVGGAMSAGAASDAADAQAGAARDANKLSKEQFEAMRTDLQPYRDYGAGATNLLTQYLGITPAASSNAPVSGGATGGAPRLTADQLRNELIGQYSRDSVPTYADNEGNFRLDDGAKTVDEAGLNAAIQARMDEYARQDAAAAATAAPQAQSPNFGALLKNFTGEDLASEPGYQFGLQQGQQQLDRRAAAGGNYFSGAALKGAARFGNDYAGTKYGEAFNRDSANKTRIYNFLSGGASLGQNAAAQTGNAGQAMAQQVGANTMGAANAQGAAGIAGANAFSSGINNVAGMYQQNQLVDKIWGGNKGFGYEPWQTTGNGMPAGY